MSEKDENQLNELIRLAMDSIAVAISIIDSEGTLVYYNRQAAKILDRKPEYIGADIRSHHKKAASIETINQMLGEFKSGRTEPFHYEAKPYGTTIAVTLSPIFKAGHFVGCTQAVRPKPEADSV